MNTHPSRRGVLLGLSALALAGCGSRAGSGRAVQTQPVATTSHSSTGPIRHHYGADPSQWGDLYRPGTAEPVGVAVIIHGGFWLSQYDATLGASLAADLAARGWVAWNLEYRRVGNGGGWPSTLADVAAGIDKLAEFGLDLTRVVAIGHSAGGQLATWAAGRAKLPATAPGAVAKVALTAVVSQAGVLDLVTAAEQSVGGTAVQSLLGGQPGAVPVRYREASPQAQLPLTVPVRCVHSRADQNVPFSQSADYVSAAKRAGADAELVEVTGDHFALINTGSTAWAAIVNLLPALLT